MEKLLSLNNAMKTKSSLEFLFDHPEMVEHGQEYMDNLLEQDKENYIDCFLTDISWLDYYNLSKYIKESIGDEMDVVGDDEDMEFYTVYWNSDFEDYITFEYVNSYHVFHRVGKTVRVSCLESLKDTDKEGREYTFIGVARNLGQELEIQAGNGNCAYYYIGERYFEVWIDSRFYNGKEEI